MAMAGRMRRVVSRVLRNLIGTLATGYILFFFSERLFWTVWREEDSLSDLTITWLAYSAIAYLFLTVVSWSRAADFWSIYLAGAIYGWLVEGALIDTLYGTQPSAPFPVSISITGLSWHALISVMVGWWATGRALVAARPTRLAWLSLAVGVFWGLWAMFPRRESPPIITPMPEFLANASVLTFGLMASWWLSFRANVQNFRPGRFGVVLCTLVSGLFYVQYVAKLGMLPLVVLPLLLCTAGAALYREQHHAERSVYTDYGEFRPARLVVLVLTPIAATMTYAFAAAAGMDETPISTIVYYYLCGPAGFVLFVAAIVVILSRKNAKEWVRDDQ
jgi:hypothetical protein